MPHPGRASGGNTVMRQRASGNGIGIVGVWAGSPLSSWAPVNLSSSQNLLGRTVSTPTAALRAQTIVTFHRGFPTQGQQPLYTGGESCIRSLFHCKLVNLHIRSSRRSNCWSSGKEPFRFATGKAPLSRKIRVATRVLKSPRVALPLGTKIQQQHCCLPNWAAVVVRLVLLRLERLRLHTR